MKRACIDVALTNSPDQKDWYKPIQMWAPPFISPYNVVLTQSLYGTAYGKKNAGFYMTSLKHWSSWDFSFLIC